MQQSVDVRPCTRLCLLITAAANATAVTAAMPVSPVALLTGCVVIGVLTVAVAADIATRAFALLDAALELDPFCVCAYILRSEICVALGDFDGARKARQKAHNAAPPYYFVDSSTADRRFRGWYSWYNGFGNGVGFRVNQKPIWQKIIPADSYEEDGVTVRCCDLQSDSSGWYFTVENAHETYTTLVRKSEADVIWEADLESYLET